MTEIKNCQLCGKEFLKSSKSGKSKWTKRPNYKVDRIRQLKSLGIRCPIEIRRK